MTLINNRKIKFKVAKQLASAILLIMGFHFPVFATHAQCENIEEIIGSIEQQAEVYYSTKVYVFSDKKLLQQLENSRNVFNDEKYNALLITMKNSFDDNEKLLNNFADISRYMHEWTGKQCF